MKYSIVIPIYNDAYLADEMCSEVVKVFPDHKGKMELIFVNDGSKDDSLEVLCSLQGKYPFVKIIDLSRNFGQHLALACGFREAKGEVVIRMNVDMQDPPSELPKLLKVLVDEDADMVIGRYKERKSPLKDKITSFLFFRLFKFLTDIDVPYDTSPMRVMNRRFIDAYNMLTEKSRFPQGLDQWLGFRQRYVEIEHRQRSDKKSSYTFKSRLKLAADGILYFSDKPIKIVMLIGFIIACIGFIAGAAILLARWLGLVSLPGYASLAALGLTTLGIQLTSMGLIGLYIGKIFKEVQNRPLYLVRKTYG